LFPGSHVRFVEEELYPILTKAMEKTPESPLDSPMYSIEVKQGNKRVRVWCALNVIYERKESQVRNGRRYSWKKPLGDIDCLFYLADHDTALLEFYSICRDMKEGDFDFVKSKSRKGDLVFVELKTENSKHKAYDQLKRAKKYFQMPKDHLFYVYFDKAGRYRVLRYPELQNLIGRPTTFNDYQKLSLLGETLSSSIGVELPTEV